MKRIVILLVLALLNLSLVMAQEHNFEDARQLIENKVSCSKLSNEQLETIGDYYMEQMHPGDAHDVMDLMMGGEGSESLKQVHINIAKSFYCGENNAMSPAMMNMMMGRGNRMMGNDFGYGMMNSYSPFGWFGFGFIFMLIFWGLIIWLIVWIIKNYSKSHSDSASEILKKRFAKGEITKKEFERIRKDLK